jgi:hypothetical protein
MTMFKLILLFVLVSCSSTKEVVEGYDGTLLAKAQRAIVGKSPKETLKLLGNPVVQGMCKRCAPPQGAYRMIYLTKDMSRFYLELSYNTDQSIDCLVVDFYPDPKLKRYVYNAKKGFRKEKNCNRKGGAILEFQQILEMEEKEAAAKKK